MAGYRERQNFDGGSESVKESNDTS